MIPDNWGRPNGRAPRGSCLAISAHLSDKEGGDRTTMLRRRDVGAVSNISATKAN